MSSVYINIPGYGDPAWKTPVASVATLPAVGNSIGDARVAEDTFNVYVWNGSAWVTSSGGGGGSGGVTTVGAIDSQAQAANALVIAGTTIYAQSAATGFPGMVNTTTQSFAGNKTFAGTIAASNLSGTNTGDQTITLTSDVTGSGTGSFATTIAAGAVTLAKMANLAANSIIGNNTGSPATPLALTTAQVNTLLGTVTAIGAAGSSPNASGGVVSSGTLTLEPADGTHPGLISTASQTIAGSKTLGQNVSDKTTIGAASSTALHQINGGLQLTSRTITGNLTVDTTTTDYQIMCNNTSGITVTLPAPTAGRTLVITDIKGTAQTNNVTIAQHASEKIGGIAASYIFQTNFGSITLNTDGTDWYFS